ncbi:MAG: hypothetical protein KDD12_21260 [Lewinella sp.]|nr:hypothetical protein [Lewinella sp.]
MRKLTGLFCFLFLGGAHLPAQIQRIMHQDVETGEAATIRIEICNDFVVEPWVGSNLLLETTVKIDEGTEAILKYYIEKGRYKIDADTTGGVIRLYCEESDRKVLGTKSGAWKETIVTRVFIPESFAKTAEQTWTKNGSPAEPARKGNQPD